MEAFAHPFDHFIKLSKGLEEVQENSVTGEFLVCVMPGCGSVHKCGICSWILSSSSFPHTALGVVLMLA